MSDKQPPPPAAPPPGPLATPPKRHRTNLIIIGSAAAVIAAVIATGIIVVQTRDDKDSPRSPAPRATASDATLNTEEEQQPTPQDTDPQIKKLQERAVYANGTAVSLSDYQRGTSTANASPANTPYVSFTIKIENGSTSAFDVETGYLSCFHGEESQQSEQIFDERLHGLPDLRLRPGRTAKATMACEMPKDESYLQIEFTPSSDLPQTVFAGDVK